MQNQQIQFISTSPDELNELISTNIQKQLEDLKKHLTPKEPDKLMTRSEVAEYFSINLSTVHEWTKSGKLTAYGKGNRVYYKRSEIEASLIKLNKQQ